MRRFGIVIAVLAVALLGAFGAREKIRGGDSPVVIVHWSNSHPMRDGLLPDMARRFNEQHHRTASGRRIEIDMVQCDSAVQRDDIAARVRAAVPPSNGCGGANPTIVTPQADDWLVDMNNAAGRQVIDLTQTKSIANTWVGIVTYKDMAECLGWPDKQLGYEDLIELMRLGWNSRPCAKAEWGTTPLLAFTNPNTSTTGRSVLISLFAIAAHKREVERLTNADISRPAVQQFVKGFQHFVSHYMPGTIPLNTKVDQGRSFGQFFLMPEDNLVSLYKGAEKVIGADGKSRAITPVRDLVMIYPKEGSTLSSNPAGVVDAPWVTPEARKAATKWIDFLREDEQQRRFMSAGFRPATSLPPGDAISPDYGLDPTKPDPANVIDPARLAPDVLRHILASWNVVKKPAIVTFVVDRSGSMGNDSKLDNAKAGLYRVLDNMPDTNQVGLVSFSDASDIKVRAPTSLTAGRSALGQAVKDLEPAGGTALYDAVQRAVQVSEETDPQLDATRAVVILSDGEANAGKVTLQDLVSLRSVDERPVTFTGMERATAHGPNGPVKEEDVVGHPKQRLRRPVQIFFIGFGDADINIGRIFAQATGAEFESSTEANLAAVIDEFGAYF